MSDYLGSKYSDKIFPNAIITDDSKIINKSEIIKTEINKKQFWNVYKNEIQIKYNRPCSLIEKQKTLEGRYKIPFPNLFIKAERLRKKRNMTNLTPDEIVLVEKIKRNLQIKTLYSTLSFYLFASLLLYRNRSYITKLYFFSTVLTGLLFGFCLGNLLNIRESVILMDSLGEEFELSRNVKQSIFAKRRDLSPEMKSEIYSMHNTLVENKIKYI